MHLLSWETLAGDADGIKIRLQRDTFVSDYAILSHRWGKPEDEVSYEDMLAGGYEHKKGYAKLIGCCKQARKDGLRHVWVDTCCINKSSSAELSEAITSMFTYYERAKVCYAFLDDVSLDDNAQNGAPPPLFSRSAWFTRGWTLQELIAPTHVKFFDASWSFLGYKTDKWLTPTIESVTGIDSIVLNIPATTKVMSIAKKMSWAARRETTRVEDMAYSLMGIFGVYMPPLYGEGTHAFIRLQEAIMKTSNDQTIFAWTSPPATPLGHGFEHVSTMLALSPSQFRDSSNFKPLSLGEYNKTLAKGGCKLDYATTNTGLSIRLPIFKIQAVKGLYAAFIACTESKDKVPSAIFLRAGSDTPAGHFWRTNCQNGPTERGGQPWFSLPGRHGLATQDIYVLPRFTSASEQNIEPAWDNLDVDEIKGPILQRLKPAPQLASTGVLEHLRHVPDPGIHQLKFLHQARQMIATQQIDRLVDQIHPWLRFSRATLPPRNRSFYGRADVLQGLADIFSPSKRSATKAPIIRILSGMVGVGKTDLATEFSHHCVEHHIFDMVLWIQADSHGSLFQSFSNIVSDLSLLRPEYSNKSVIEAVKQWLSDLNQCTDYSGPMARSKDWLLVFDNVQDGRHLFDFLPSTGAGCVLMTSRNPDLWYRIGTDKIVLEPFTTQESCAVLSKLTRIDGDFTEISNGLGGLPLALSQVARFIIRAQLSLDQSARVFSQAKQDDAPTYLDPMRDVWSVLETSFRDLPSSSLAVLQVLSFLDPDFIRWSILDPPQLLPLQSFPIDTFDLLESRIELLNTFVIMTSDNGGGVRMHTLVQQAVRKRMKLDERHKALSTAVALVSSSWAKTCSEEPGNESSSETREELRPHVLCLNTYEGEMTDSEDDFCTKTEFSRLRKEFGV
ncbi:hypothetical protein CEP54_010098 [Fusarium duplospermum]|uniref:Heterokaryon incompatibility domain-containing protein n=1 Tax=Fusarium duplospermum TaxID=1325734 RepID=A0A428PM34_9HYPO|nr:hypothetical protein CEP54_010098 [Fusarium duplospermum]